MVCLEMLDKMRPVPFGAQPMDAFEFFASPVDQSAYPNYTSIVSAVNCCHVVVERVSHESQHTLIHTLLSRERRTADVYAWVDVSFAAAQIRQPSDFGTIAGKLRRREYADVREFEDEVKLVFNNCYAFNHTPGPEIPGIIVACNLVKEKYTAVFNEHKAELMSLVRWRCRCSVTCAAVVLHALVRRAAAVPIPDSTALASGRIQLPLPTVTLTLVLPRSTSLPVAQRRAVADVLVACVSVYLQARSRPRDFGNDIVGGAVVQPVAVSSAAGGAVKKPGGGKQPRGEGTGGGGGGRKANAPSSAPVDVPASALVSVSPPTASATLLHGGILVADDARVEARSDAKISSLIFDDLDSPTPILSSAMAPPAPPPLPTVPAVRQAAAPRPPPQAAPPPQVVPPPVVPRVAAPSLPRVTSPANMDEARVKGQCRCTPLWRVVGLGFVVVVKCGVEWSGVDWIGVEWSGVEWSGVEWSGVEWRANHRW
jgi:hypothetical protein